MSLKNEGKLVNKIYLKLHMEDDGSVPVPSKPGTILLTQFKPPLSLQKVEYLTFPVWLCVYNPMTAVTSPGGVCIKCTQYPSGVCPAVNAVVRRKNCYLRVINTNISVI